LGEKTSAHHCSLVHKHTTGSKQFNNVTHRFTSTHKAYYNDITVAQAENTKKGVDPSFPYLEKG